MGVKPRIDKNTNKQYELRGSKGWYLTLTDEQGSPWSTSTLSTSTFTTGTEIEGTITPKEFGGRTFYDFKEIAPSATPAPLITRNDPTVQSSIVKQSSLKAAIDFYNGSQPTSPTVDDILETADEFVSWVEGKRVVLDKDEVNIDDIPF